MRYVLCFAIVCLLSGCATEQMPISSGEVNLYYCHLTDCSSVIENRLMTADEYSCAFYTLEGPIKERALRTRESFVVDEDADLPLPTRKGDGLMHNKFCILDETTVVTGSYNPSNHQNYDHLLIVESKPLARQFDEAFQQLLRTKKVPSKTTRFLHNNNLYESYACPQDDCHAALLKTIAAANESIRFALFTFTDPEVSRLLIQKHRSGLLVGGIIESYQSRKYGQYDELQDAGVPVLLEDSSWLQHNKVFIIDGTAVITGSYNPTKAAYTTNDERLLVLHDEELAHAYDRMITDIINRTQSFK